MEIYIINFCLIIALYIMLFKIYKTKKSKIIFCVAVFILFSLIQGLRAYSVGNDTNNYIRFFELSKDMSLIDVILTRQWTIEPGFGLLIKISSALNFSPQLYLLLVAIIINGGLMYCIYKNSDNPFASVMIFMGVEFFTLSFTALRQMIAVIIILNSYHFIKQRKLIKFIIMVLLAATFHKTALIFLPVYFLKDIKINLKTIYIGIALLLIAQLIAVPIVTFLTKLIYTESYIKVIGGGITQTLVILVYLISGIFIYKDSIKKDDGTENIILIFIYFAFLIQSLACRINMINRLMWYFYIFIIIYLPNMTKDISKTVIVKNKEIKLSTVYECVIILLSMIQYLFFSMDIYNVVPYNF